jgi:hypothetical protein
MKKSDFIEKVLKHDKNTVFVSKAIVERTLEIFEDLGMLPPYFQGSLTNYDIAMGSNPYRWELEDEKK